MLEKEWYIQALLGFYDNKVLKKNGYTNICWSVQIILTMKKEYMKSIRKGLGSLEYYDGRSSGRATKSQRP